MHSFCVKPGLTARLVGSRAVLGILLLASVTAAACRDANTDAPVTTTTPDGTSTAPSSEAAARMDHALVRMVHAIPAGATVDLGAGNDRIFENIAYRTVTPYKEVDGQRYTFTLRPAGLLQSDPLASNSEGLDDGEYYTVFAVPGDDEAAMLRVVEDDFSRPAEGKARVRVVNASRDLGELEVRASGRDDDLFQGIDFQTVSEYDEVDPWSGSLDVRAEGEDVSLARVDNASFEAGKVYTLVVVGKLRGTPRLEAFVIEDQLGSPSATR